MGKRGNKEADSGGAAVRMACRWKWHILTYGLWNTLVDRM